MPAAYSEEVEHRFREEVEHGPGVVGSLTEARFAFGRGWGGDAGPEAAESGKRSAGQRIGGSAPRRAVRRRARGRAASPTPRQPRPSGCRTGSLRLPRFRGQVNAWVPIMTGPRMDGFACESSTRKKRCGPVGISRPRRRRRRQRSPARFPTACGRPPRRSADAARRPAGVHRPGRSTAPPAPARSADAASRRLSAPRRRRRAVRPRAIMPSPCFRQQRR